MLDGRVEPFGGGSVLRFDRLIDRPIEKVWAALTDPARIADWLGEAEVELRIGGNYRLRFFTGGTMEGVIRRLVPMHVLEHSWREGSHPDSLVTWELRPEDEGCRLILTHSFPPGDVELADYASGWHWHLDAIPAAADGVATPWDRDAWLALRQGYAARLA